MLLSDLARPWKILAALLLFYGGGLYGHLARQVLEPPPWAIVASPLEHDGKPTWLYASTVLDVNYVTSTLVVAPKGYRMEIRATPETMPSGVRPGSRLYARLRYVPEEGFLLEPDARTTPPRRVAHLDLWLVSLPALAFVVAAFLRQFRPAGLAVLSPREEAPLA